MRDAHAAGVRRLWMQQQTESEVAIRYCQENGISVVYGECILMRYPDGHKGWKDRMHLVGSDLCFVKRNDPEANDPEWVNDVPGCP